MKRLLLISLLAAGLLPSTLRAAGFDLAAALARAKPGDCIEFPPGVYDGPIIVDKPVSLRGDKGAILDGHGSGDVVQIRAAGASLRGFTIRGSGTDIEHESAGVQILAPNVTVEDNVLCDVFFGIRIIQSRGCVIRGNIVGGKNFEQARRGDGIKLWYSADCTLDGNVVHDVRDVVIWFSRNVRVIGNHVLRSRYGLHFMYCDDNVLEGNRLEDNSVGVYLMNSRNLRLHGNVLARNRGVSGYGLGLKDMDGVEASDNRFVANRVGVYIDSSPTAANIHNHFTRNLFAFNDIGIALLPSVRNNQFCDNTFQENQEQVAILGGGALLGNDFSVAGRGNYWSDYRGFSRKGTDIGELPYRSQSFFENLTDREPKLRLFLYSPAQQAIEMASQAFPVVKPRAKFVDDAPLMRPVPLNIQADVAGFGWPVAGAGSAMLLIGMAILGLACSNGHVMVVASFAGRLMNGAGMKAQAIAAKFRVEDPSMPGRHPLEEKPAVSFSSSAPILRVEKLRKRFGRYIAVDDLNFEIHRGQAVALWGSNGAGKTTAIRCVLGLVRSQGTITIAGRRLCGSGKAARGLIGYVPQENSFQGDQSVLEALRFYGRLKGAVGNAPRLLAEVGLQDHAGKRVSELSGGMRKRLALAAALLNDPPLLVLDEIAANLDAEARQAFLQMLTRLKERGKTILFVSHRLDEVEALADRVLVLKRGALLRECPPDQLATVLGLRRQVKLHLPDAQIAPALAALNDHGFAARRNGREIWVSVVPGDKAAPIHLLARQQIVIHDFELETEEPEDTHVQRVNT